MTTNTGQHPGAEGPWHDVSDAALVAQRTLQDYWRGHAPFVPDGPADADALVSFDEIAEQYALARVVRNLDDCQAIAGREADEHDDDPRLLTEREQVIREAFDTLPDVDQVLIWGGIDGDSGAQGTIGATTQASK